MLRCFNDCFAVFFLWLSIFFLQRRSWAVATAFYTLGLGVKMSLLLVLPALGTILLLGAGFLPALSLGAQIVLSQLLLAVPFLAHNPSGYLGRAFEFSRQFFYKWTVNWRFVSEHTFLSKPFALTLLALHVVTLVAFMTHRWLKPARLSTVALLSRVLTGKQPFATKKEEEQVKRAVTPEYVLTTMLGANIVGLLFARSLHYQFYAYLAWSTPFLLWRAGLHPVLVYVVWAAQEWGWNVFPSTSISSAVVVGCMALTVASVWAGAREEQVLIAGRVDKKERDNR